jgi:hypothetical protein
MFKFNGKEYQYLDMSPNDTRLNERRVEVALGLDFLEKTRGQVVLEVGNVMRHYVDKGFYTHDILDLEETNPNFPEIMNQDILSWKPNKRYDTTLSISTLEHTGNPLKAVNNILSYSKHCFITMPLGVDGVLDVAEAYPDNVKFMKRINDKENEWVETTKEDVKNTKYNEPFYCANAIMILIK